MILNPSVALILDKAADNVTEVPTMPTAVTACGQNMGDNGYDAETAVCFAMIDLGLMDRIEMSSGSPHLTEILAQVANFGAVPEHDRDAQNSFFLGNGRDPEKVQDRDRRRNDVLMWARGLPTTEVAQLYRWAADEFRSRPETEGVYDTAGTREIGLSFHTGVWGRTMRTVADTFAKLGPEMGQTGAMALYGMATSVFVDEYTPDPDAGVITRREDVTAARIAEIAQGVIEMIEHNGWGDTYLFNPENGRVSLRGAMAAVVDLPPRQDYLSSPLHLTERRWVEYYRFDDAVADYVGITHGPRECAGCGGVHQDDRLGTWENEGHTHDEIVTILTGVRDSYLAVAASESLGEVSDADLELFVRELFGEKTDG